MLKVWMSHGDTVTRLPEQFELLASTRSINIAAYQSKPGAYKFPVFGLQFHRLLIKWRHLQALQ